MKDYNAAVEMKSIGASATSQEMVELSKSSQIQGEKESKTLEDDDFDLLANEVDSLTIKKEAKVEDDEFEVIPIPACFDLEVPFELIDKENEEKVDDDDKGEDEIFEQLSLVDKIDLTAESIKEVEKFNEIRIVDAQTTLSPKPLTTLSEHIEKLVKLGFGNRDQNRKLLELHNNDIERVLQVVFEDNKTDWAAMRH